MNTVLKLPDFVIPNGQADSNILDVFAAGLETVDGFTFIAPGTLPETVNLMISNDGGNTYGKYSTAFAAGVALITGEKDLLGATHIKITSTTNVAASRTFKASATEETC